MFHVEIETLCRTSNWTLYLIHSVDYFNFVNHDMVPLSFTCTWNWTCNFQLISLRSTFQPNTFIHCPMCSAWQFTHYYDEWFFFYHSYIQFFFNVCVYVYKEIHVCVCVCIYIIIIIIMSCRQHGYPWPSLATSPYHSSPPAGLLGYIPCPHIAAVCKFGLVVLLLLGHMWGSIGVRYLRARPCFSSSVQRVWLV